MKKFSLILLVSGIIFTTYGGEFRFGKGSFEIKSDIFGTDGKIKEDTTTYSLVEIHKNIFNSRIFYSYDITFITSKTEQKYLNLYNSTVETFPSPNQYQPIMKYELQGLDGQVNLGGDILKKNKNYLGSSIFFGISLPYIKSSNDSSNTDTTKQYLPDSKTKLKTYRVGLSLHGGYELIPRLNLFGTVSYGYQTGNVENKQWGIDGSVNGTYLSALFGLKFNIVESSKKIWFITLSPRVYITSGFKYDRWEVNDIKINNTALNITKDDLTMENKYGFFGFGYSF